MGVCVFSSVDKNPAPVNSYNVQEVESQDVNHGLCARAHRFKYDSQISDVGTRGAGEDQGVQLIKKTV